MTNTHFTNPRDRRAQRGAAQTLERAERKARRLTDEERRDRGLTEIEFQRQLVGPNGLATMLGWLHVHFRPAKTERGWRTPGSGELLEGWPDLVLVRARDRRLIFAELKRELAQLTPAQAFVLDELDVLAFDPADYADRVTAVLRHQPVGVSARDEAWSTWRNALPRIDVVTWRPSDLSSGRIQEVLS